MDKVYEDLVFGDNGLMGSQCSNCKEYFFPKVKSCSNCASVEIENKNFGTTGRLWSWTTQNISPKAPYFLHENKENFEIYGVGFIEMPCGIKVKSRLQVSDTKFKINQKMELKTSILEKPDGATLPIFEFRVGKE